MRTIILFTAILLCFPAFSQPVKKWATPARMENLEQARQLSENGQQALQLFYQAGYEDKLPPEEIRKLVVRAHKQLKAAHQTYRDVYTEVLAGANEPPKSEGKAELPDILRAEGSFYFAKADSLRQASKGLAFAQSHRNQQNANHFEKLAILRLQQAINWLYAPDKHGQKQWVVNDSLRYHVMEYLRDNDVTPYFAEVYRNINDTTSIADIQSGWFAYTQSEKFAPDSATKKQAGEALWAMAKEEESPSRTEGGIAQHTESQQSTQTADGEAHRGQGQFQSDNYRTDYNPNAIYYTIQVAAHRGELPQGVKKQLRRFGNLQAYQVRGMNKYTTGKYNSYLAAREAMRETGRKDFFVTAYHEGRPMRIREAIKHTDKEYYARLRKAENRQTPDTYFAIQLGEFTHQLSQKELASIYPGHLPVRQFYKEGKYFYEIGIFLNQARARELTQYLANQQAQIKAYQKNQEKSPGAPHQENDRAQAVGNQTYYTIQILATRQPVPQNRLKAYYQGNWKIKQYRENGWYKYYIGHFPSKQKAHGQLRKLGIPDAFVVPSPVRPQQNPTLRYVDNY